MSRKKLAIEWCEGDPNRFVVASSNLRLYSLHYKVRPGPLTSLSLVAFSSPRFDPCLVGSTS